MATEVDDWTDSSIDSDDSNGTTSISSGDKAGRYRWSAMKLGTSASRDLACQTELTGSVCYQHCYTGASVTRHSEIFKLDRSRTTGRAMQDVASQTKSTGLICSREEIERLRRLPAPLPRSVPTTPVDGSSLVDDFFRAVYDRSAPIDNNLGGICNRRRSALIDSSLSGICDKVTLTDNNITGICDTSKICDRSALINNNTSGISDSSSLVDSNRSGICDRSTSIALITNAVPTLTTEMLTALSAAIFNMVEGQTDWDAIGAEFGIGRGLDVPGATSSRVAACDVGCGTDGDGVFRSRTIMVDRGAQTGSRAVLHKRSQAGVTMANKRTLVCMPAVDEKPAKRKPVDRVDVAVQVDGLSAWAHKGTQTLPNYLRSLFHPSPLGLCILVLCSVHVFEVITNMILG